MGFPKDKKPKKTYTLNNFAKKELRKQQLSSNENALKEGLKNASFSYHPVDTTTFEPPLTQNVTQTQPIQQTETTEQPQNYLLQYGNSGLPNSEVSTLLGSVLTGQTQQNLYDNVLHSLGKMKEGAESLNLDNAGLNYNNALAGLKFMNGLAGLSFFPITAVNEVMKQNPVTDWLNKGAMLPFELADELYTLTQKGTDYAFEKITGHKPDRSDPLSQELDEFLRTSTQLLIGGKAFHETGKFFKKGMPEEPGIKQMSYDEYKNTYDKEPQLININLPEFQQFRENNPTLLLSEKAGADFYATPDGQIITLTDYEKPAKNVTNGMTQEEIKLSQKNISGEKLTAKEQSKINFQITDNADLTETDATGKKPYEEPATIIGEQPKQNNVEIDLGNKRRTFTKIINEFDKDLQSIEQRLASGEITKQEFDELEKQYNETENKKKTWQKRLDEIQEEPKPIETVTENKRKSNDPYSEENIKNPQYPDRTNEVIEQPKTEGVTEPTEILSEKPKIIKVSSLKTDEGKFSIYDTEKDVRGRANMFTVLEDNNGWIVRNAIIPDNLQQQGIATEFYKRMNDESIKNTGKPLRSTQSRELITGGKVHEVSQEGIKLWDSLVRKGLAEKISDKNYKFKEVIPETKQIETPTISLPKADLKVEDSAKLPEPKQDAVEKVEGESNESKKEISRWEDIIQKQEGKGIERLKSYMASKTLGRDFGETVSAMFERKGLTDFNKWATDKIKNYDKTRPESKLTPEKPVGPPTLEQKKETRRQNLAEKKNKSDATTKDIMPKEIADLYMRRSTLTFTENALRKQMGDKELKGKAKIEYNNLVKELSEVESKIAEYEQSKNPVIEETVAKNQEVSKASLPPSLAERYEALKKEKEQYEKKLFKEKHTYYDSKTLEYERKLDKLQERIDEVNKTKSIAEKKEAKGTEQGKTKVKGENLLQQINKAIEDVKEVDINKETPTAIASKLKELGYEIDAVKSGEFDESFQIMYNRAQTEKDINFNSSRLTGKLADTGSVVKPIPNTKLNNLSKVGIGEPRIVFKDANGTYKIPIEKLSEFKTKLEKAKIYNEAKQTIKSALKKDSGISFGGLSKLGDLADPKVLKAVYDVAKYHTGKFAEWSKKVIADVGNWIKPHLRNLYNEVTKDRTGLDNVVTQGLNLKPIKQEVKESFTGAVDKIKRGADTIRKIIAPVTRGENAKLTAKIITEKNAELVRQEAIISEGFKEARKQFDKRSNADNLKMIDAIETGSEINNPLEKSFADEVRKLLDAEYKKVTDRKGVKSFIENYFPHIWEQDSQNQLQAMLSRRPLEGSKSFLKKRTIPTTREGIEAGLKPVTYNPVDLALLKLHEMKKFNMAHEIMDNLKAEGLVKYIPTDYFAPAGWTKLNDKIGTIFGDPGITATEYVDKHLYNALQKLATDLGIKHSRVAELRGTRMGEASPAGYINTKYATPEDVLAHEIGHHLQFKYNLWDYLTGDIHVEGRNKTDTLKKTRQERVKIHKELRALADLRAKGEKVSDSHKRYLREKDEKMAVVLQAYTHIPAEMREVAPTIFSKFEKFIDSKPQLQQIKQIKPSLVPKGMDMKYDKNGILIKGHYYLPEPAARIINNHLSPGLKGEPVFDIYRGISNTLNQVQLGASLFHASFTSGDANLSKLALGLMKISRGKKEGFLDIATSPIAFITNPIEGNKIRKDYLSDRPNNPELVNAITRAGGRISMDRFYTNDLYTTVKKAFKDGKYISGSLKSPFAMFEVLSKPVLEYLVPRQKLGVFSGLAKDILQDEAKGKLTKDQATERLQEAWRSVDNRMGQLVYDNLYWDHVVKDIAMASVRSVGWNLGTFRELGGGIRDIPKIITEKRLTPRTAYALALPIGIGLLGAVYSYLNGTPAESIKDLYFPRTGHKNKDGVDDRISLPSYMKDVFAYGTDIKSALNTRDLGAGAKTLSHKMHPAISMLLDLINNHDYFGNEISDNTPFSPEWFVDEAKYIAQQFRPFTVNNISEMNKQGEPLSKQLQSFFGFQLAPGYIRRSDMQNKIYDTYQKRNGEKIISKPEAETRELKRELKDLYLKDKNAYDEKIADLLEEGKISSRELNSIESDKPTDIKLFKYLPADDKIELWNQMNKEEKQRYQDGLTNKIRKTLNLPYKIPSNAPKGIIEKATPEQYTEYENEAEKRIMQFEKDNKGMDKDELQKQRNKIRKDIRKEMNLETEKEKKETHLYIPGQQNYFNQPKTFKNHLTIPK